MKMFNPKAILALVFGILAISLLLYFYFAQRNFERNYKEVRALFHLIDRSYHRLNYEILRSSIFAYSNQDGIIAELAAMKDNYAEIQRHGVWQEAHYQRSAFALLQLRQTLEEYEAAINDYLMINAGIKNSFVYVGSLPEKKIRLFASRPEIFSKILLIVAQVSRARMLSDPIFVDTMNADIDELRKESRLLDGEQQHFLDTFILHSRYIARNYAQYADVISQVESSRIDLHLEKIETEFLSAAQSDFQMLDRFVIILLVFFLMALVVIIALLIRSDTENRRLRKLEADLRYSLSHDQLTGLLSRNSFESLLSRFGSPVLILINIDHFKHINDFYGLKAGNMILKELAVLIRQPVLGSFNPNFFRLGGDDFGIVLQGCDVERAQQLGTMLKQVIENYAFTVDAIEINITVAVGVNATLPLLENADLTVKHIKKIHSDAVMPYSQKLKLKEKARDNLVTTRKIKSAIDADEVVPWFQPIVSLDDGEVVKYESLVRIQRKDGTIETPGSFLDIAMQTPYYRQITRIMVEKVMSRIAQTSFRFSINLSMRDLSDEKMVAMLISQLEDDPSTAARLDIELLESEEMDDMSVVHDFIDQVTSYGCRISIDDFGSGYSNFSYIINLPVDSLKIDGSLIKEMLVDEQKLASVRTIVTFARNLDLNVIAEYVGDEETAIKLREMGVHYAQGYYFGKPAPNTVGVWGVV